MNQTALRKLAAATSIVCEEFGGSVNVFPLLKSLYLADREMLASFARTITGDTYSSMPKGPVLCCTYDFVRGKSKLTVLQERWSAAFETIKDTVRPKGVIDTGALAPVEEDLLRSAARKIAEIMRSQNLADWMHQNCPEWEAVPEGKSRPLTLERMARYSMGVDEKRAKEVAATIRRSTQIRNKSVLAKGSLLQTR